MTPTGPPLPYTIPYDQAFRPNPDGWCELTGVFVFNINLGGGQSSVGVYMAPSESGIVSQANLLGAPGLILPATHGSTTAPFTYKVPPGWYVYFSHDPASNSASWQNTKILTYA